jgi:hypothetical protein
MDVPADVEDRLEELSAEQLDDVARLAERLAEEKRRQQRIEQKEEEENDEAATDIHGDSLPSGVPVKATLTKKTINDNDYWYWQWRTNDGTVTSKYKCPAGDGQSSSSCRRWLISFSRFANRVSPV